MFRYVLSLFLVVFSLAFAWEPSTEGSGKGIIIYKVEGDPGDVMIALKGNLEANQIVLVSTTDPAAPLANNIKIFPDYKKLKVDYIQNFLVTSMSTLYKIFMNDPNVMVISPLVITIYQLEGDIYLYSKDKTIFIT